ncbi:MAG: hypothetical protein HDR02_12440 [Lachnospiraceae bacterium]|nr:hypothetical protein [Lachnospiraceae bacterium]
MKKVICFLLAGILSAVALTGCGAGRDDDEGNVQELAQIEIYADDGRLIDTISDEDILRRFSSLSYTDIPVEDSEQDELASAVGNLTEVCTIVIYKAPVAVYNDGTLEKLMELTIYEDSNIVKEQFAPESIKMFKIPEEFLVFYSTVSDEEKNFMLSLAEINK